MLNTYPTYTSFSLPKAFVERFNYAAKRVFSRIRAFRSSKTPSLVRIYLSSIYCPSDDLIMTLHVESYLPYRLSSYETSYPYPIFPEN